MVFSALCEVFSLEVVWVYHLKISYRQLAPALCRLNYVYDDSGM